MIKAVAVMVLLATGAKADSGDTVKVSVGGERSFQIGDSARTATLSLEPTDSTSYFDINVGGLVRMETDDVKTGYGVGFGVDYTRLSAVTFRLSVDLTWFESLKPPDRRLDLTNYLIDLGVLLQPSVSRFEPYVGGGLSFYGNHIAKPEDQPLVGDIYEEGMTYDHNAGTGFGGHIRAGGKFRLSGKVKLALDLKYAFIKPKVDYLWVNPISGEPESDEIKLDMEALSVWLGVSFPVR